MAPLWNYNDRRHLCRALLQADRQPIFEKFFDLPAELRCEVYKHLFAPTDPWREPVSVRHPKIPNIAKASGLLRRETIPVYLQSTNFEIDMRQRPDRTMYIHVVSSWLLRVPNHFAKHIRHLTVLALVNHERFRNSIT